MLIEPRVNAVRVEHVLAVRNHLHRVPLSQLLQAYRALRAPLPAVRHHRQALLCLRRRCRALLPAAAVGSGGGGVGGELAEVEEDEADEEEGGEEDEEDVGHAR